MEEKSDARATGLRPAPERDQLYDEWVDANRKRVDDLSNKQIGYVYMKNMSGDALDSLKKTWYQIL